MSDISIRIKIIRTRNDWLYKAATSGRGPPVTTNTGCISKLQQFRRIAI